MNQGFPALGEELGFPEHVTPSAFVRSWMQSNPSPPPKLCLPVKNEEAEREVGLPEHDVTSLHSLEEGFDSTKPTPSAPHPKLCPLVDRICLSAGTAHTNVISLCNRSS